MDLDRYYTPSSIARQLVEATNAQTMQSCVDPACGGGSLLRASEQSFPGVLCIGMDRDRRAITRLVREKPSWVLSRGDLLRRDSWAGTPVLKRGTHCDYVLMNPPFSMGQSKGALATWEHEELRSSVAMSHILMTLQVFQPKRGGAAVVPESLMHSELDEPARSALTARYDLTVVKGIANTTFSGARANSLLVRILAHDRSLQPQVRTVDSAPTVWVVRGGLPVFCARRRRDGLPFVHSTAISPLVHGRKKLLDLPRVAGIAHGTVPRGHVILIPRVGVPRAEDLVPFVLSCEVQLSDCVIALRFPSARTARQCAERIHDAWFGFSSLYRGTGARYVTMRRLLEWRDKERHHD